MRFGGWPGRDAAIARRIRQLKRQRRWLLGATVGALGAGAVGGYLAGDAMSAPRRPRSARLRWARAAARGPLGHLVASHAAYCVVAERAPAHDELWFGIERLGWAAVEAPAWVREHGVDPGMLARRVLRALEGRSDHAARAELVAALRSRARGG